MSEQNGIHQAYFGLTTDQLNDLAQRVAERLPLERFALNRDAINQISQAVQDKLITMRTMDVLAAAMGRSLTGVNLSLTDQAITRVAAEFRKGVADAVIKVDAKAFAVIVADLLRADPLRVVTDPTQAAAELQRIRPLVQMVETQTAELRGLEMQLHRHHEAVDEREREQNEREQQLNAQANRYGPRMTTTQVAARLGIRPESIRQTLMHNQGNYYGVRPEKEGNRLRWPADTMAQLERVGKLAKSAS